MADQATLNQEQITKVRQNLSLNIYSTDSGTKTYVTGNSFRIETPMTVPVNDQETPIGYINSTGTVTYDLLIKDGKVAPSRIRATISNVSYTRTEIQAFGSGNANYRIDSPTGTIFNKDYSPTGGNWSENVNRVIDLNDMQISSRVNEQKQQIVTTHDEWQYNPTNSSVSLSLTVPNISILDVPKATNDEGTLVIKYVNAVTGDTLWETSKKVPRDSNQFYTAPSVYIFAYKLISTQMLQATVPSGGTKEFIFKYNPAYAIKVHYVDSATNQDIPSKPVYTQSVFRGEPFRHTPPEIQGYRLASGSTGVDIPSVTSNGDYYIRYDKIPSTVNVTVRYLNRANYSPLKSDAVLYNQPIGQTIRYTPPTIDGYAPEKTEYTYNVVEGNNVLMIFYTENAKIRPWAIRKYGNWSSLNTLRTWMKIRRTANQNYWDTKPNAEIQASDAGKDDFSPSRIRKSGKWKAQGKIGN